MTTRVTPWQTSQSRSSSSDRVVVAQVRTSCRRRPGLVSCGTRTHAVSVALPMSSAATRSTSAVSSSVISSMPIPFQRGLIPGGLPAGAKRGHQKRNRVLEATMQDPCGRLPAPGSDAGSAAPSVGDVGGHPCRFSRLQGVAAATPEDSYVCQPLRRGRFSCMPGLCERARCFSSEAGPLLGWLWLSSAGGHGGSGGAVRTGMSH